MKRSSCLPSSVTIVEVGARDGLQNEAMVSTEVKIALVNQLSKSGLTHIETGAFVSPKWVPQMADSTQVFQGIARQPNVIYSALTPNLKGFEQAMISGADQVSIFTSASEAFCQKNINCSISESLRRFEPLIEQAKHHNIAVRAYLSCVVDCPYDGPTKPQQVAAIANELFNMGCYEVSLGDTIGTGTPLRIATMLEAVQQCIPTNHIAVHFHDTWGQAIANIYQALTMGIHIIDSSVAGLGGCPYASGASGNVATEDVLYLCQELNIETGINLSTIASAGKIICQQLHKRSASKVSNAIEHIFPQ
ncbi:MAG: hydroxymethylglutaryl-CoA lyase [Aliivibrio sp.]|uniref:hydroxymethylglutaryl-CoA lyase n=1 Tax=Aliivibrio sp. TaxID=1872443 RepID=UPI001A60D371|nr:hydroxymethylglutaryl-CoA lyase [Aliivibrio sp.]